MFWALWPVLWLYLRWSHRTRLLIVCGNEFLAVRSWLGPGAYGLPGGGLHKNESPVDGLRREVKEEIGLNLQPQQLKHIYHAMSRSQHFTFPYDCFLLELDEKPQLMLQKSEIIDAQWLPLNNPNKPIESDITQALGWWHAHL